MRSRISTISRTWISMSVDWPCAPPWGWWISTRAFGSVKRMPGRAGGQQHGGRRRGLADAHRRHRRPQELHRVVDGEERGHVAAGAVDVEVDRPVRVLPLEEQQLGDDQVGHAVVERGAEEHDPVAQQPRPDVVGPLAAGGALEDGGDDHERLHVQLIGCTWRVRVQIRDSQPYGCVTWTPSNARSPSPSTSRRRGSLLTRPDDLRGWLGAEVVLDPTPGRAGSGRRPRRHASGGWWSTPSSRAAARLALVERRGARRRRSQVEITLVPAERRHHRARRGGAGRRATPVAQAAGRRGLVAPPAAPRGAPPGRRRRPGVSPA